MRGHGPHICGPSWPLQLCERREYRRPNRLGPLPLSLQYLVLDRMARYDLALPRRSYPSSDPSTGECAEHCFELALELLCGYGNWTDVPKHRLGNICFLCGIELGHNATMCHLVLPGNQEVLP